LARARPAAMQIAAIPKLVLCALSSISVCVHVSSISVSVRVSCVLSVSRVLSACMCHVLARAGVCALHNTYDKTCI
jgi:hypothetical protein